MKKIFALAIIAILILSAAAVAQSTLYARAEYEGFGYVEVDLSRDVRWDNIQISVTDEMGFPYEAELIKRDEDDVHLKIVDIVEDQNYTITISGIQGGETVSCELIASKSTLIKKVEYDADDRELEVKFSGRVEYSEPAVTVTDASGAEYKSWISEKDKDSLDLLVDGLTIGETYTVTVSGVGPAGENAFETAAFEFIAFDD